MEIPLPLALLTALPVFVSLTLLPIAFLLPNCPCCDDCGQDVYDEVYVSYTADWQYSGQYISQLITYQSSPFPEHWYRPVRDEFNQPSQGFFLFGPVPEMQETAAVVTRNDGGFAISTSGQVTCINIGKSSTAVYPSGSTNTVLDHWRYVYNANYTGAGCSANGVDVVVRPTCPNKDRIGDRWYVDCYWCAGESDQSFLHGGELQPTSPRIPSTGQINSTPVTVLPGTATYSPPLFGGSAIPIFPDFPYSDGWTHAVLKSDMSTASSGSGSSASPVPDFSAIHDKATQETVQQIWRLGGSVTTSFNFDGQLKQQTTNAASILDTRPDYLIDADAALLDGRVIMKQNPCSTPPCNSSIGQPTLIGYPFGGGQSNFINSSWYDFLSSAATKVVSFYEMTGETIIGSDQQEYYLLKRVLNKGFLPFNPDLSGGSNEAAAVSKTASITLAFE